MAITYKKLWKLLIDKNLKKRDLQKMADISNSSIAKLGRKIGRASCRERV